MSVFETLATAGNGYRKVRYKGIDTIGYVDDEGNAVSQQAWAAAKGHDQRVDQERDSDTGQFTGGVVEVDDLDDEPVDTGPTGDSFRWDWIFADRSELIDANITWLEWYHPHGRGVPIDDYADNTDMVLDELVLETEEVADFYPSYRYNWGIRYVVLGDEETIVDVNHEERYAEIDVQGYIERRDFSLRRMGFKDTREELLAPAEGKAYEMKFEDTVRELLQIATSYEDVIVFQTIIEAQKFRQ